MKTIAITFCLLSLVQLRSFSQNQFLKEYRFQQKVTIADGNISSPNASLIIAKLADGNGKAPRSTSFTIEFEQLLQLNTREVTFVYKVISGSLHCKGDINYKGFDMSDEIIPDELRYNLRLKNNKGVFKDVPISVLINNGKPEMGSYNNTDSTNDFNSFDIVNLIFRYGNSNDFENKIKTINTYYNQISNLDNGFLLLQSVLPAQVDNFRNNNRNLIGAEKILVETEQMNFANVLPLSVNDPGRLNEKLMAYRNLFDQKRQAMEVVWKSLHLTFFDRGIDQMRKGKKNQARENFLLSLEVNPLFSPALLQIAILDFESGNLHEAVCKADDILYNMPTDPETKKMTFLLVEDIYRTYLHRANQENKRKNFSKALDEYESARILCEKYVTIKCSEELSQGIAAAKKGIYYQMLDEAEDYIILNEFDRAEYSAKEAINYQLDNKSDIENASEAYSVLITIRQKRYDQLIQKAIMLTDRKMYNAALVSFQTADSLALAQNISVQKDIRQITLSAARPRVIELLYEGESYVKINDLQNARICYHKSVEVQQKYALSGESDIIKHTQNLKKHIFTQECLNLQNYADSCYNRGQSFESNENYLSANNAYQAGIDKVNSNVECGVTSDSLESALLNIRNAVTFLELIARVDSDQENGNYQAALDNFQKASRYYSEMNVARFGITHDPDIFRFIREKGNAGLIYFSGDWYREKGELDHSLSLYRLLMDRNYDTKSLNGSLYKLGYSFGLKEKKLNPGSSWKDIVKHYTEGEKKLKRFAKGFKKGFRS